MKYKIIDRLTGQLLHETSNAVLAGKYMISGLLVIKVLNGKIEGVLNAKNS